MKTIQYSSLPVAAKSQLLNEYKQIFDDYLADNGSVAGMETKWSTWKTTNDPANTIPESIDVLLTADFKTLVDVYERFGKLTFPRTVKGANGKDVKSQEMKDLESIFAYTNFFDTKIADFFIKWSEMLKIRTCYYCDMAYVNTYEYIDDKGKVAKKRQFDLDHFLPKAICPCVGLSLFNFVPSCQVCNSRIKGDKLPTDITSELEVLSPTSKDTDFDNNVAIRLRMIPVDKKLLGKRSIYIRTNPPYNKFVHFFHLEDRYEFHKVEAQRIKKLKDRYPDSNIKKIAKLLHRRECSVREDIFQVRYLEQEGRCFERLSRDILTNHKI